ncbi:MAG: tRNA (adenosine(37)-N6)-dimethylallyltransferase MiaA [Crocinitomicaceae bacterium]|nr:tRNA (adenosine(37)-N6)-dimethylallyltransferase MiaA [Crocinitomicaceae bacterium]
MSKQPHVLVILGPTASGKTRLACGAALKLGGEIISADSRQVYKFMDIGTGKDIEEYSVDNQTIPYHLIDIHNPGYKYNIAEFQLDFLNVMKEIHDRKAVPILCGGSGLYIEAALQGNSYLGIPMNKTRQKELEQLTDKALGQLFDQLSDRVKQDLNKETRRRIIRAIIIDEYLKEHPDFKTVEIPAFKYTVVGVKIDRETRRDKISKRLSYRMNNGLIEEVEWLLDNYLTHEDLDYYGLEYKWVGMYLRKEISKKDLFEGLQTAIHQFAKRQMTWFRRMEKNGFEIHWVNVDQDYDKMVGEVVDLYQS